MAFTAPSADDLVTRYPEFAEADVDLINSILDEVIPDIGSNWIERDRVPAILALAAHRLTVAAEQAASYVSAISGADVAGPAVRETVGPLSVMYQKASDSVAGGSSGTTGAGAASPYMERYELLRRRSHPTIAIV